MKNAAFLTAFVLALGLTSGFAQTFTIKSESANMLFTDVGNTLDISVPGYEQSQITVYLDNEKITGVNGRYYIDAHSYPVGQEVKVKVGVIKDNKEEIIGEQNFYTNRKSPYTIVLGTFKSRDVLTLAQFAELDSLTILNPNCTILKYTCATVPRGEGNAEFFSGTDNKLSQQLLTSASRLLNGGKVLFDEIILIDKFGERHKASPVILTIK